MTTRERWFLIGLLFLAFSLRVLALDDFPPGLRYDEMQNHLMAGRVLAGERPIYFAESWGHEPLYHYLQAASLWRFGQSDWSLRLPSAFLGLFEVVGLWLVGRWMFSRRTALLAATFLTVSFWAIFYSRIGSRVGPTTVFVCFAMFFLWQTWQGKFVSIGWRWLAAVLGGLFSAAAVYVYVAGRVGLGIVAAFILYAALVHRRRLAAVWPQLLLLGLLGAVLTIPIFGELRSNPELEQRLALLNQPLSALREGDIGPVLDLTARAWGMYFVQGEKDWLFNVYGRPIFDVFSASLFVLGIGISAWRWRRPQYALLLIWLVAGTAPAMVAPPAASLTHTIAAQPAAFLLTALGLDAAWRWLDARMSRLGLAVAVLALLFFGIASFIAYFVEWSAAPEVRELYQGGITAVADALTDEPPAGPVLVGAPFISYWQPWNAASLDLAMTQDVSQIRFFNPAGAWVWPTEASAGTYYFPTDPLGPQQKDHELIDIFAQDAVPLPIAHDDFTAYRLDEKGAFEDWLAQAAAETTLQWPPNLTQQGEAMPPLNFGDRLALLAVEVPEEITGPGEVVRFLSFWEVISADPAPLVSFVHVTDDGIGIWGQQDWLDVRMAGLQPGDRFVQVHNVTLQPETPQGVYHLQLGLYNPENLVRLPILLPDDQAAGDHIWVGPEIQVR